ncbi:MAG: ATP-binding protein [Bacteroidales bacterium]
MKLSYRQRLFLYFAIIFSIFTIGVVVFEQSRGKKFKTESLEEKLGAYTEIVNAALVINNGNYSKIMDSLVLIFPQNMRVSLINRDGIVLFDNSISDLSALENHAERPEIKEALHGYNGTDIRTSISNNRKYLYYAKKFGDRYIRVALPYTIETQSFLKTDNTFIYFIIVLFIVMLMLMNVVTSRFGKSIKELRDFAINSNKEEINEINFPNDELGEVGLKIVESYRELNASKRETEAQREKLLQHVHSSEEGICFFSVKKEVEFYNSLFIQYLNTLTDEPSSDPSLIFSDNTFKEVSEQLSNNNSTFFESTITKQGKTFSIRINTFEDNSFEVILNDITKQEKTRLLKQQMTGNIGHELRTPVTSIRGYLETVMEQSLDKKTKDHFITQAFDQTILLSELIQDMSLISKIEEAPQLFKLEKVNLTILLQKLIKVFSKQLDKKAIAVKWNIPNNLIIRGNESLIYSIFRNLTENTICYAGQGVKIEINLYNQDKEYYYFSFADNGIGIPDEKHLTRLFERFYRINEGRTRDTGGSGLGLSIVKNAISFHKGTITAKNRKEGGLEFLFQLHK